MYVLTYCMCVCSSVKWAIPTYAVIRVFPYMLYVFSTIRMYKICDVSVKLHYFVTGLLIAVGNELVIKLADFGMARHVRDKNFYRVDGKARLPVKWMAPESLLYGEFSEATDVW